MAETSLTQTRQPLQSAPRIEILQIRTESDYSRLKDSKAEKAGFHQGSDCRSGRENQKDQKRESDDEEIADHVLLPWSSILIL